MDCTRLIQHDEYRNTWGSIHNAIFVNHYPPDLPFKIESWRAVLIPDSLNFSQSVFNAVGSIARRIGDMEFVVETWEVIDGSLPPVSISWNYLEMSALVGSERSHFENHIYAKSGTWGISCSNERNLSYIGGESKFMEVLVAALGGMEDLRRSFLIHMDELSEYDDEFLQTLLGSIGWAR